MAEISEQRYRDSLLHALMLHPALPHNPLFLMYQKKIDLNTGNVAGYEALLRWVHKDAGYISPEICLQIAEAYDLSRELHMWVVHQACFDMRRSKSLQVAVNICPALLDKQMAEDIMEIIYEMGISPDRLHIELTEHNPPKNMFELAKNVAWLRQRGVKVALDDFGTGHATMSYLAKVDLDYVKIDKSYVQGIGFDPDKKAMFKNLLSLISVTGAKVIAEGVEDQDDLNTLTDLGVDQAQGYFFDKPQAIDMILVEEDSVIQVA